MIGKSSFIFSNGWKMLTEPTSRFAYPSKEGRAEQDESPPGRGARRAGWVVLALALVVFPFTAFSENGAKAPVEGPKPPPQEAAEFQKEVKEIRNQRDAAHGPLDKKGGGTAGGKTTSGKSGGSDAGGYDLYPDEAEAVVRYNADRTASNLEDIARIRFMYAAAMAAEFEKTGDADLLTKGLNYAVSAAELSPRNAYYMFLPAYIYSLSAKSSPYASTMAEDYAKAALDLDPNYMEARTLLANLYLWRNSYDNALNEFERLVQDYPGYIRPDTLVCMCHAYRQDGQQDRGEAFFRRMTAQHPESSLVKLALASMLKDRGKKDESKQMLQAMLSDKRVLPEVQDAARVGLHDWFGEEVRP